MIIYSFLGNVQMTIIKKKRRLKKDIRKILKKNIKIFTRIMLQK